MNTFAYVDFLNDNLICCICRAPFVEPLKARTCCHTFCRECILTALSISKQCPIDRCPLAVDDLSPADPLIRNLVDELEVYCPQKDVGCLHKTQRQLLESHLRESCLFVQVPCADEVCDKNVLRKFAKHSNHLDPAPAEVRKDASEDGTEDSNVSDSCVKCPSCSLEVPFSERHTHDDRCPSTTVSCRHLANGCPWTGPCSESASHLHSCPYEAIKGFFDVFSSKMSAMSSENSVLRRKIEALEGSMNVLRQENEDLKRALGPWYRPHAHDDAPFASTSRYTTEMIPPPAERPAPRARQSRSSATSSGTRSENSDSSTPPLSTVPLPHSPSRTPNATGHAGSRHQSGDASDLASYFPPESDDELVFEEHGLLEHPSDVLFSLDGATLAPPDSTGGSGQARSPSSSYLYPYHDSHPQAYPSASPYALPPGTLPPASSSASPPQIPAVAPLNINTSLHRSLLSLRESIVTLSAAVDSLARRQDVALATEAMRLNEEVRSLRVVLHGLRMQMHAIMMDRNAQVVATSSSPRPPVSDATLSLGPGPNTVAPAWLAGIPLPFVGPRLPPYPFQQVQNQSVSGPKL